MPTPPRPRSTLVNLKVLVSAILGGVLLLTGPWYVSAVGGVVAGIWVLRRGWFFGGIAVALAWGALTAWNYAVAPAEVANLASIMGAFAGVPSWLMPVASVLFGFVLGAAGGFLGSSLSVLLSRKAEN